MEKRIDSSELTASAIYGPEPFDQQSLKYN